MMFRTWPKKTTGISYDPKILIIQIRLYSEQQVEKVMNYLSSKDGEKITEDDRTAIYKAIASRELVCYSKNQAYIRKKIGDIL